MRRKVWQCELNTFEGLWMATEHSENGGRRIAV